MITQTPIIEEAITQIASKNDERQTLRQCLDRPIIDTMTSNARTEVDSLSDNQALLARPRVIAQALKQKDAIEVLIQNLIAQEANLECRKYIEAFRKGKAGTPPDSFPRAHKQAQAIVEGQIASSVGVNQCRQFLVNESIGRQIRVMSKDLFFAINNGLDVDQQIRFTRLMFELLQLQTTEPISQFGLRQVIANSITAKKPLELVHIKSLRFTYPQGTHLKILDHTDSVTQLGQPGETRTYPSEQVIFTRLESLAQTISGYGIAVNITVIVSDHDLDYCFPQKQTIVPNQDVVEAHRTIPRYMHHLRSSYPSLHFFTLTEFLQSTGAKDNYQTIFNQVLSQCQLGGGNLMGEQIIEMRVDHQTAHYSHMFGNYSRQLARHTAYHQLSNALALTAVFEAFPTTPVLVIDSRGLKDRLIGSFRPKSVVKYFTKLKDPTKIEKA